jgi:flagellar biosynthesis regulator FlaF
MSNPNQEVLNAYTNHQHRHEDNRDLDKRALLTHANRLKIAIDNQGQDMNLYCEAIKGNQELWTIFQVALTDPESKLSDDLKIILLNLSRFIDRTSFRAVTKFQPQLLASLIEINISIAKGLAQKPKANETPNITIEQTQQVSQSVMISA